MAFFPTFVTQNEYEIALDTLKDAHIKKTQLKTPFNSHFAMHKSLENELSKQDDNDFGNIAKIEQLNKDITALESEEKEPRFTQYSKNLDEIQAIINKSEQTKSIYYTQETIKKDYDDLTDLYYSICPFL